MPYDIVIVGGGPAGLSAAVNAAARGKTCAVRREAPKGTLLHNGSADCVGLFVVLDDKAAEGFGPVDPGSKEESSDNGGAPDTGRAFPAAALLVLAGAAGAVLALRKRKS